MKNEEVDLDGPLRVVTLNNSVFVKGEGSMWEMFSHINAFIFIDQMKNRTWAGWKQKKEFFSELKNGYI